MTITKKKQDEDWNATRKKAIKDSIAESVKEGIEEEEEPKLQISISTSQLTNDGTITMDTSHLTTTDSIQYLAGTGTGSGTLSIGTDSYLTGPNDYSHTWEPKSNITTFELALSLPYLINTKQFYDDDPEMREPFARHFKIYDTDGDIIEFGN